MERQLWLRLTRGDDERDAACLVSEDSCVQSGGRWCSGDGGAQLVGYALVGGISDEVGRCLGNLFSCNYI